MLTDIDRQIDREQWWSIHDPETYICPDCHRTHDEIDRWEVHHLGGVPGNIVGLCQTCHKVRHGATRREIDLSVWKDEFLSLGTGA